MSNLYINNKWQKSLSNKKVVEAFSRRDSFGAGLVIKSRNNIAGKYWIQLEK